MREGKTQRKTWTPVKKQYPGVISKSKRLIKIINKQRQSVMLDFFYKLQ